MCSYVLIWRRFLSKPLIERLLPNFKPLRWAQSQDEAVYQNYILETLWFIVTQISIKTHNQHCYYNVSLFVHGDV